MSRRWTDIRNYGILVIFLVIGNSFIGLIPWFPHFAGLLTLLGGIFLYAKTGGSGVDFQSLLETSSDSSSGPEVQVDPDEAPQKLNEKVRQHPARKELRIDRTHRDSTDYSEVAREVTINGKEKLFWGVIGRPRSSKYSEKMRYIYNLTDDQIFAYDPQVKSIEGRLDPFYGYTWLTKRGVNAQRGSGTGGGKNTVVFENAGGSSRPTEDGEGGN